MANKELCSCPKQLRSKHISVEKTNRYGWRLTENTLQAVQFTFNSSSTENKSNSDSQEDYLKGRQSISEETMNNETGSNLCEMQQRIDKTDASGSSEGVALNDNSKESLSSMKSIGSFVCRICHNAEHPERLVSPCLCKGTLSYVHIFCLEHWISTSGKTNCELCQFQYKTIQTLRYTCLQSLRMWYSHSMSRRALQDDCQMFSLLTLVAFGIIGTILVGTQHYIGQERSMNLPTIARVWTRAWLSFFLLTTFSVYFVNVYVLIRGQLSPWYRWWQSAREIKLILENRKISHPPRKLEKSDSTARLATLIEMPTNYKDLPNGTPVEEQDLEVPISTVQLASITYAENNERTADVRRNALVPSEVDLSIGVKNSTPQQAQPQGGQQEEQQQEQEEQSESEQVQGQQKQKKKLKQQMEQEQHQHQEELQQQQQQPQHQPQQQLPQQQQQQQQQQHQEQKQEDEKHPQIEVIK